MSIIKDIFNWISGAAKAVANALTKGNAIANEIKAVADSPILDVVVNLTATNIDNQGLEYVRKGLTVFIMAMGWGQKTINNFNTDKDGKAIAMIALNAKASVLVAEWTGAKLSIEQAMASAPLVYNPDIVKV